MSNGLTMTNLMGTDARSVINKKSSEVQYAGQSLSTGQKKMTAVESYVSGLLRGESNLLKTIVQNTNNASNIFRTAQKALGEMTKSLEDMLSVVAQARGNSPENTKTLNTALKYAVDEVSRLVQSTSFNGRKLLTGQISSDPSIVSKYNTKAVGVQRQSTDTNFAAAGTKGVNTITVGAVVVGEVLRIGDASFTAVSGKPQNEGEFSIGSTAAETTGNLATAILNSSSEGLRKYQLNVPTATTITLTQIAPTDANLRVSASDANGAVSTTITNAVTAAGTQGPIDLSGIKDVSAFIGAPNTSVSRVAHVVSAGTEAKDLASQLDNAAALAAVSAVGDSAAVYEMNIGGKVFSGAIFQANGGNLNNAVLKMTHEATGESFTMNFAAGYAGAVDTAVHADAVATDIRVFFEQSKFAQTRVLEINTEQGDIVNNANLIGSTTGLTASLTSTDFENKKFTGVEIKTGAAAGDVDIKVFAENVAGHKQTFHANVAATSLVQGYKLDLTDDFGDVLSLNIGQGGLASLAYVENYKSIEQALDNALRKTGSGLEVRVGTGFDDVLNMKVGDMSLTKLFRDDEGKMVSELSILDDLSSRVAQEVIENALKMVRSEMSNVQTQLENLENISKSISATIDITQAAADSYSKADLVEEAQKFSEAIKSITAAIAGYQAGNKVTDAAERLLQGL